MAVLRRPMPRFFLWAVLLAAVAAATWAAALSPWWIALAEAAAWLVMTIVDRAIWRRSIASVAAAPVPVELPAEPAAELTAVIAAPVIVQPEPVPEPEPERKRIVRPRAGGPPALRSQVRWNVWSLEKLADVHPEREELGFLVVSLREFADADGQLPADFDPLVRESFADLLPG